MKSVNLGGQRLGTGNKMNVNLHGYDRSTFNLSKVFRSSMAPGTLVPCYVNIGENGDTFDINIKEMVRTLPTNGPLMGSFKLQIDFFTAPIRLYNGLLHNNAIGVGLDMDKIKFPQLNIDQEINQWNKKDGKQIATSSLMAYCGLRGLGNMQINVAIRNEVERANFYRKKINALPFLAYYDIFKNYYSNKQEENCYIISADQEKINQISHVWCLTTINSGQTWNRTELDINKLSNGTENFSFKRDQSTQTGIYIFIMGETDAQTAEMWKNRDYLKLIIESGGTEYYSPIEQNQENGWRKIDYLQLNQTNFPDKDYPTELEGRYVIELISMAESKIPTINGGLSTDDYIIRGIFYEYGNIYRNTTSLKAFPLQNFDDIREYILKHSEKGLPPELPLLEPLITITNKTLGGNTFNKFAQNGLMVKTYLSDIFNNWLNSETIDGENGINAISKVSTEGGSFTIDALNLAQKVYNLLNRIAVSGGTYNDWQEAVFDVETTGQAETPIYYGGLSAEIAFEEVVSTADTTGTQAGEQPLGSLAGKGSSRQRNEGHVIIKVTEPSIIMGIVSITPRLDYSQGNKWFLTELQSMNDLHKPALDGIGFQDLMLERMVGESVEFELVPGSSQWIEKTEQKAVGKQPAWIEYQTDINECFGDFAEENKAMYMTLNRRYNIDENGNVTDVTTYIDPSKFNYAFADTAIEAQNFWVQIAMDIEARRKMSAKMIPNI